VAEERAYACCRGVGVDVLAAVFADVVGLSQTDTFLTQMLTEM